MPKTILGRGDTLGDYRIEDLIGIGEMRIIYRAEQLSRGRRVALEVTERELSPAPRFQHAGRRVSKPDSANAVRVFESGEADGCLFVATRLGAGTTLADRMEVRGVSAGETVAWLAPIASALDTAHSMGIVHGDVTPETIEFSQFGDPYLAGFGRTKVSSSGRGARRAGSVVGNVNYAAPERIHAGASTAAGDIYALTAVLYECLTGEVPFPRDTDSAVIDAQLHDSPPSLRLDGARVVELDRVIGRGMAKKEEDRWHRATDVTSQASSIIDEIDGLARAAGPAFCASPEGSRFRGDAIAWLDESFAGSDWASSERDFDEITPELILGTAGVGVPAEVSPRVNDEDGRTLTVPLMVLVVVAVVLMVWLGHPRSSAPQPSQPSQPSHPVARYALRSGPIQLAYRAPWKVGTAAGQIASAFSSPSVITDGPVSLTVGALRVSAPVPGGVPAVLTAGLGQPSSSGAVALDGVTARAYRWALDGRAATAIILGARDADLGFVCQGPTPVALRGCIALSRTALVTGVQVIAPGAPRSEVAGLRVALAPVSGARRKLVAMVGRSLVNRASIAAMLSRVDGHAATAVEKVPVLSRSLSLRTALVRSLHAESILFAGLWGAAHADQRARFSEIGARLTLQSRAVAAAVRALANAGILITPPILVSVPAPPLLKRIRPKTVPAVKPAAPSSSDAGASQTAAYGASASSTVAPAPVYTAPAPAAATPAPAAPSTPAVTTPAPAPTKSSSAPSSATTSTSSSSPSPLPPHKGLPSTINLGG